MLAIQYDPLQHGEYCPSPCPSCHIGACVRERCRSLLRTEVPSFGAKATLLGTEATADGKCRAWGQNAIGAEAWADNVSRMLHTHGAVQAEVSRVLRVFLCVCVSLSVSVFVRAL